MSYRPDSFVTSPGAVDHDPKWQLHSSTDSYLNWNANAKVPEEQHPLRSSTTAAAPDLARLHSAGSNAATPAANGDTPSESASADATSILSHHGHTTSPERSVSPSYFTKHYFKPPNRSSATSPTITLTGAPIDSALLASSRSPPMPLDSNRDDQTTRRSSGGNLATSPPASSNAPISPTVSSKPTSSAGGFFASLRPSSPGNLSISTNFRSQDAESSTSKARRPSSVLEHVGNVWERIGRKVHHTRTATSEQQPSSASHTRRSASQTSPRLGLDPESADTLESTRRSPSESFTSQPSPAQSTTTESECRTPATPSGETLAPLTMSQPAPSAPAYSSVSAQGSSPSAAQQEEIEELPYLAAESPHSQGVVSTSSIDSPRVASGSRPSAAHRRVSSAFERVLIQVTDDNERFSVVDISGVDSADAIKERMFAKLHLYDADHSSFQLFRTEIGQSEASGPVVSDDVLLVLCLQMGDDRGTLKFLVQQTAPPSNSTVRALPPPTSAAPPQRALNDARRTSGNGSVASQHFRTESQSSKSSMSDALVHPEMFGADGSHEGSNRNSASSLTRSKATARRALPSAPPIDDLRSPTHSGSNSGSQSALQDRRSIASSGDGSANESSAKHGGSASEGVTPVVVTQRSSSISANVPTAPGSAASGGRRPSHNDAETLRLDAELYGDRSSNASAANGPGHRQERSDDGARGSSRQQMTPAFTLHNAKSMDDLHRAVQPTAHVPSMTTQAEVRKQAGMDRDGRYPTPAILRPSTAAPAGPGARESGSSHRQYSLEMLPSGRATAEPIPGQDPRLLQRNRSAQAAIPSGQHMNDHGPMRMSSNPQIRSPPLPNAYTVQGQGDPRFHGQPPPSAPPMQVRPPSMVGRPQFSAPPSYAGQPTYATQPYGPVTPRPMGPGYVNEFGTRTAGPGPNFNTYHGHDPRMNAGVMQASLTSRPYSYHDQQPPMHQHPAYRPYGQPNPAAASPYRTREDPFAARYFPASSSRQVSEFQMQAGRLEPGMTVQQTLRTQEVIRSHTPMASPGHPYPAGHAHPPGPSYGPRDPRQPAQQNQYTGMSNYSNAPGAPQMQKRPSYNGSTIPNPHHQPSPRPQAHPYPHSQAPSQPLRSAHDSYPASPAGLASPQMRPQSASSSVGRGPTLQQHYQQQQQAQPQQQQQLNSAGAMSGPESHRRDPPVRANTSERSSGSSFSSQGSFQRRRPSNEGRTSIEDSFSAPTSARSSQSGPISAKPANGEPRCSFGNAERELADDELEHVRPLPRLPNSSANTPTESSRPVSSNTYSALGEHVRKSEDEDTLRAGEWAQLWRSIDPNADGTVSGTAISGSSGGDGDTVRADSGTPGPTRPQTTEGTSSSRFAPPRTSSPSLAPEENGTVASFGNFDDDESESGTWAQPLDSDVNAPRLPLRLGGDDEQSSDGHGTLLPGEGTLPQTSSGLSARPELKLTIDPATGPTVVGSNLPPMSSSPRTSSSHLSSAINSGGITRSNSFARRDDDWAFRPPPEQLYENLDDFFPKHDLDKPLLDTAAVPESPMVSSPRSDGPAEIASSPPSVSSLGPQHAFGQRSRHKKSIRLVAQDRKKIMDKRPAAQGSGTGDGLLRRRSTKLWGTKVVEMTPGQELAAPASATQAESPSSDTASPKPVFKWVKGDLIGKGTYGRVYLALNATTGEMIAVKQVELPRTASDREDSRQKSVVAALKSEIETLKDLDHPHIVSYLGFEETTTFLSIFLEYVPGGSVGSCLRKHGKFEEPTIKSFLHQILSGLAYLHSKGILHRDLKADNILVDFEGVCKISDFGTVRRSDDIYGNVENMSLQGSIFWMAPEVVSLSKKGYSAKIDIWSLGCVVLEMFAGRRPWSDDEAVQAMFKIGAERKAPPIPADVKLSKQAAHFLKNCFEVDPAKRPTAQRLLDHVFSVPDDGWHFQQSALWRSLQR